MKKAVDEAMNGADVVVHFAAESHVDRSIQSPDVFVRTNVLGTQSLLKSARKYQVKRFHHVSTDEVFGSLPLDSKEKWNEQTPYNPAQSVLGQQSRVRSFGPRLLLYLRLADNNQQLRQQHWPVYVSGKIDSACNHQSFGRQKSPGLQTRQPNSRMALCGRPLQWHRCDFKKRQNRRNLFYRPGQSGIY